MSRPVAVIPEPVAREIVAVLSRALAKVDTTPPVPLCEHHATVLAAFRRRCPHEPADDFARRARTVAGQCRDCIDAEAARER